MPVPMKNSVATWRELEEELKCWAKGSATFWWRNDDTTARTTSLDRLLDVAGDVPVALAVIPARVELTLTGVLKSHDGLRVLVHGWAHANHNSSGEPPAEYGYARSLESILAELSRAQQHLKASLGDKILPVLVPPWNRVGVGIVSNLSSIGFRGLSTFGARLAQRPAEYIEQVNTHVDLVDWTRDRGFVGVSVALGAIVRHLKSRRLAYTDSAEPTGILSHHEMHGAEALAFLCDFATFVRTHPSARWLEINEVFG